MSSPKTLPPPRKRLGQHFLADPHILNKIVDALHIQPEQTILEIGPGRGALTALLLEQPITVYGVELDQDLVTLLRQQYPALHVYADDALHFDYRQVLPQPYRVVGNLPYNIATALIFRFIDSIDSFSDITIMLQKEVAERMIAPPTVRHMVG